MSTAVELDAGTLVGGYRIEALVGRGGMGVVYRARQLALDRPVALKLIAPELAREEGFRERFEREAKLAAALEHPHVLPVHEAGEVEGLLFLAMRYVDGRDLSALLADEGQLEPARAASIVAQVAEALDAAHGRGLVHRDVKPQNVMVERLGGGEHAFLCDFGLSRLAAVTGDLTASGRFLGTVDYASPEQIRGEPVNEQSDVYALGCLLFQALTGRVPYPREDELAKLWAHLHEPPPAASALRPELEGFDRVIARALAKEPADRYQAAGELARAALAAAGGRPPAPRRLSSLRVPATPLVGRQRELRELGALLERPGVRLVTLTGAGGSGKTRLALALAAELAATVADGVFFCELDRLPDAGLLPSTIAKALGIGEAGAEPLLERLQAYVSHKSLLLVLDGFEQVLDAAPALTELLAVAPRLRLLVTSRAPLHLSGEHEYPVPPLAVPDAERPREPASVAGYDAVALFVERVRSVKPDFRLTAESAPVVAEICRRLDGLPLALELAAARIKVLPPQALLSRLSRSLEILSGGRRDLPERQRTLRATMEWSLGLLTEPEQRLFARLGVFAGGFRLEAAEAVAASEGELDVLEGVASLVDRSLLVEREEPEGEPRFAMLTTVREYALERLEENGEGEDLRARHADYFLDLAEATGSELEGPKRLSDLHRLERELDNLRAALDFYIEDEASEQALRLAGALSWHWFQRGHLNEGLASIEHVLALESERYAELRAAALLAAARLRREQGDRAAAGSLAEESLRLFEASGHRSGVALALYQLSIVSYFEGRESAPRAIELAQRALALARESQDGVALAQILNGLGLALLYSGDHDRAVAALEEAAAIQRLRGNEWGVGAAVHNLGCAALERDDLGRAEECLLEGLEIFQRLDDRHGVAVSLLLLAQIAERRQGAGRCVRLWAAAVAILEAIGAELDFTEAEVQEALLANCGDALGDAGFATAWRTGSGMSEEDAASYALGRG